MNEELLQPEEWTRTERERGQQEKEGEPAAATLQSSGDWWCYWSYTHREISEQDLSLRVRLDTDQIKQKV